MHYSAHPVCFIALCTNTFLNCITDSADGIFLYISSSEYRELKLWGLAEQLVFQEGSIGFNLYCVQM
jgi:hypothetical protein